DLDQLERRLILYALLAFLGVIVIEAGEHFGWWNDLGEAALRILTVAAALLAVLVFVNATKGQVRLVVVGVGEANQQLRGQGEEQRRQSTMLARITELLEDIRDRL
ncbi:MAG: hypothetical protein ACRDH5_18545, partial [bacterium]